MRTVRSVVAALALMGTLLGTCYAEWEERQAREEPVQVRIDARRTTLYLPGAAGASDNLAERRRGAREGVPGAGVRLS
jgi:hypothetical protein